MSKLTTKDHDSVEALREKMKKASDEAYKTRLKAIILAKQGKNRAEIVKMLIVGRSSITVWRKRYNEKGTAGLASNKGGRPKGNHKWSDDIFADLAQEIDKGGYWSIPRMQAWIKEHKRKDIPEQTVWMRMDKLNYSYKSARPHPTQGNRDKQAAFKKGGSRRTFSR